MNNDLVPPTEGCVDVRTSAQTSLVKSSLFATEGSLWQKSILFLDWDDTLFPTTYLFPNPNLVKIDFKRQLRDYQLTDSEKEKLNECYDKIIALLEQAVKEHMLIYLVTNAKCEWIYSAITYMYPKFTSTELFSKMNIVSARDKYESQHQQHPELWKHFTFRDIITENNTHNIHNTINNTINNIISIGDSDYERTSVRSMKHEINYENVMLKTIKMIDRPKRIDYLIAQLKYVVDNLSDIIHKQNDVDIRLKTKYDYVNSMITVEASDLNNDMNDDDDSFEFTNILSDSDDDFGFYFDSIEVKIDIGREKIINANNFTQKLVEDQLLVKSSNTLLSQALVLSDNPGSELSIEPLVLNPPNHSVYNDHININSDVGIESEIDFDVSAMVSFDSKYESVSNTGVSEHVNTNKCDRKTSYIFIFVILCCFVAYVLFYSFN